MSNFGSFALDNSEIAKSRELQLRVAHGDDGFDVGKKTYVAFRGR
jgi:hypothetical protein